MEHRRPHLNIPLRRSPLVAAYIIASHLAALIALTMTALPAYFSIPLALLITLHSGFVWRGYWRSEGSYLRHDSYGWHYEAAGQSLDLYPVGEQVIWPWLLILNFRTDSGRRLSLVLPPDAADKQDLRRLRVLLRHFKARDQVWGTRSR